MSDNQLLSTINLGRDAESFLNSPLGQHFQAKMDKKEREAEIAMREVNPRDPDAVVALQNRLIVIDECRKFFIETMESGYVSTSEYENDVEINQHNEYVKP